MCATAEEGYAFSGGEGEVAVKVEEGGCAGGEGGPRPPPSSQFGDNSEGHAQSASELPRLS